MSTAHLVEPHLAGFQDDFNALRHELAKVVVGHADVIEQVLIAAVAGGHVLIEGVPGLGKTLLVETLADILQLRFSRIQFTPDLTPSDLLGTFVVMENAAGRRTFEFQQGPIFSNLVLADHDQSRPAEDAVGPAPGDGRRGDQRLDRDLPSAAAVLRGRHAESAGDGRHVPLAGAGDRPLLLQADRQGAERGRDRRDFAADDGRRPGGTARGGRRQAAVGNAADRRQGVSAPPPAAAGSLRWWRPRIPTVPQAREAVKHYVRYGASPRAAQSLVLAAKVRAAANARTEVAKEDFAATIVPALRHRLLLNFEGQAENIRPESHHREHRQKHEGVSDSHQPEALTEEMNYLPR